MDLVECGLGSHFFGFQFYHHCRTYNDDYVVADDDDDNSDDEDNKTNNKRCYKCCW